MKTFVPTRLFFACTLLMLSQLLVMCRSRSCPDDLSTCEFSEKPDSAFINMQFTINNENNAVHYEIYRGYLDLDDPDTPYISDVTAASNLSLFLPLNRYTLKAVYQRDADTVWVVRSERTTFRRYKCEPDSCFSVVHADYDARLQ